VLAVAILIAATVWALVGYFLKCRPFLLYVLFVVWALGPPAWFAFEYFCLFRRHRAKVDFEHFKHGQDTMAKVWVAIVGLLAILLTTKP